MSNSNTRIWSPPHSIARQLGAGTQGIAPVHLQVQVVKPANVIVDGVIQNYCVINYRGVEYVVPTRTLSFPEVV